MLTPLVFFLSILVRVALIPLPGFKADIAYWKWWGMSAATDGFSGPLVNTAYNYPSFYIYILKATSHLYELLAGYNFKLNPQDSFFWSDTNILYLFLIKFPYILADLGIGYLIYKIVKNVIARNPAKPETKQSRWGLIATALYLFNPMVIYNSSIWGQTDSIGTLFILLSFYGLIIGKFWMMPVFAALALFMKTQTVVFIPLLFLIQIGHLGGGLSKIIKSFWIFTATVIVINLPFLATKTMERVFDIMYTSQLYFPYVSMNAYNLWWIFFGKASSSFLDQNLIAGLITYKTAGVLLFGTTYVFAVTLIIKAKTQYLASLQAFVLVSFAFFLLLTQMHERYLFPMFGFFPILLGLIFSQKKLFIIHFTLYILLSLTTLLNLHQVMIMNYPDNTLPFFPNTFNEPLTKILAIINVIIFIIFITVTFHLSGVKIKVKHLTGVFIVGCFLLLLSFIPKQLTSSSMVSLTKLKPTYVHQDFDKLRINKNLSNWWLSDFYYFAYHGLATHANSQITYNIKGKYKTFSTNFGIDTDANQNASVQFVIRGDNKILFKSPKVGRYVNPGFIKVNVTGVKTLDLLVLDGGDGINSDHADWLEPILYK